MTHMNLEDKQKRQRTHIKGIAAQHGFTHSEKCTTNRQAQCLQAAIFFQQHEFTEMTEKSWRGKPKIRHRQQTCILQIVTVTQHTTKVDSVFTSANNFRIHDFTESLTNRRRQPENEVSPHNGKLQNYVKCTATINNRLFSQRRIATDISQNTHKHTRREPEHEASAHNLVLQKNYLEKLYNTNNIHCYHSG